MRKEENEVYVFKDLKDMLKSQPSKEVIDNKYVNECVREENENFKNILVNLNRETKAKGIALFLYNEEDNKFKLRFKIGNISVIEEKYIIKLCEESKEKLIINSYIHRIIDIKETQWFKKYIENNNIDINQNCGIVRIYSIKDTNRLTGVLSIFYDKNINLQNINSNVIDYECEKLALLIKNKILTNKLREELIKRTLSESKLKSFLEIATDLWAIMDYKQQFKCVSPSVIDVTGWSNEKISTMDVFDMVHPDDRERAKKYIKFIKNAKGENSIAKVLCANGEYKIFQWNWSCIEEGKYVFLAAKDITEQKKLQQQKKELEEAIMIENFKNKFLANISHEFKTPLNVILATVQLIDKNSNDLKNDEIDIIKYIDGIKRNSYRLLRLINNLIDITKIDSGHYNLQLQNYNVVEIIEDIVMAVREYIKENTRDIIFDTSEEEIITALDENKIETIILNLLSNAIKYTNDDGIIEVSIKYSKDRKNILISIKDNGIGIDSKEINNIFQRFKYSNNILNRRCEGTGIGLSLVKSLVEMHGGKIIAKNNPIKGTEFIFSIPVKLIQGDTTNNNKILESSIEKCNIEFSDIYFL
ncbi:PAS domain S-box protein [Clostridium botulinum]|nr:PAS domain S-box protein [Clostridium botulinum]NFI18377.1 PAS domain S-box protein [Clostridium botulinum]NFI54278.1 PAS domain S-box protein [Clostridium botulinum]NFL93545.1 PAS domain S-box protein [Clostridium botulinum]NFN53066.1 PAS domain S-box protein [Clostridium botulinum]